MLKWFKKKEEKKEVKTELSPEEQTRLALQQLQNLKRFWLFLLSKYSTKKLRKEMRAYFVYDDNFSTSLINEAIEYNEMILKEKGLDKKK